MYGVGNLTYKESGQGEIWNPGQDRDGSMMANIYNTQVDRGRGFRALFVQS